MAWNKYCSMGEEEIQAMINHEASWRVPNRLTARYLGESVSDLALNNVVLTEYA